MSKNGSPQTEKSKKYDRQLRLWGDEGQSLIESANVCVIGAGATGCEVLKNIVLPGAGSFTLIDDHVVAGDDISTNFFLDPDCVGQNRAQVACKYLLELNEDVRGGYMEDSLHELLNSNSQFFHSFTVVIATDVRQEDTLRQLAFLLYELNIPLIVTKINGFFGYIRIQVKEHVIVESKPDSVLEDLRLDAPPAALIPYCDEQDLTAMDRKDLSHTPYLVILYKYLKEWRRANGRDSNSLPANYAEKQQLKNLVKSAESEFRKKFSEEEDRDLDLTNFDETISAINMVLTSSSRIPRETKEVLKMQPVDGKKNHKFWRMVRALELFVKERGCLPLRGSIPDMTSDSQRYIQLQKIYSEQAKSDIQHFSKILTADSDGIEFTDTEISTFCKNAHSLCVIKTGPFRDEFAEKGDNEPDALIALRKLIATDDMAIDNESFVTPYLMFRAVDHFHSKHQRLPGQFTDQLEEDVIQMKLSLKNILSQIGVNSTASREDLMQAFVSFGGSEIHTVAAFIGGVVGHEVIKLLTSQYVPVNHTLIYNAITSLTQTFNF